MNAVLRMEDWADKHHPGFLDIFRVALGAVLIMKGLIFLFHLSPLHNAILSSGYGLVPFLGAEYLVLVGICGGILILLGMLTRFAAIITLPIPIVELIIAIPNSFSVWNTDTLLSAIVLLFLVFFLFYGGGPYSVDHYLQSHEDD